jgi:hypothetical protein
MEGDIGNGAGQYTFGELIARENGGYVPTWIELHNPRLCARESSGLTDPDLSFIF